MATCKDCLYVEVCRGVYLAVISGKINSYEEFLKKCEKEHFEQQDISLNNCLFYKDRSRFVELIIAKKIKHSPDIEKMREFHKLGLGKGMGERSIFWTCSNCELWVSLAHKFCPNCGAKFEAEQALKERERK